MESDLKEFLETNVTNVDKAYPHVIPAIAELPAIVYTEISFERNSNSNFIDSRMTDHRFQMSIVTKSAGDTIRIKNEMIGLFEGFAGVMGSTRIFTSRVVASVPFYDTKQQTFEHTIDVMFAVDNFYVAPGA